jgi:hypothetical protein
VLAPRRPAVVAKPEQALIEDVDDRAGELGLRELRPALLQQDEVAVAVEAGVDEPLRLEQREAARTARQVHERVGRRLPADRRNYRDGEPDGGAVRPAAVLRHDEVSAARVRQRRERRQVGRTRSLLETRHVARCAGALGSGDRGAGQAQ